MNVLFWVRKNYISRTGTAQIMCSISIDSKKIEFGTKLSIEPKNWKQAKQKAFGEDSMYINDTLSKIRSEIIEIKRNFELRGFAYTLKDIKNAYLDKDKPILVQHTAKKTILEDLAKIQEIRVSLNASTTSYRDKSFLKAFKAYLSKEKLEQLESPQIKKSDILNYLDGIRTKCNAVTYNNHLSWLKLVFNLMKSRDMVEKNPCEGINKLKTQQTKSIAFAPEHTKQLAQACKLQDTELYIFCMCVFYTFIRPIELRRLKVCQVDLEQRKINILGSQSKNKKNEYVMIPDKLKDIFLESKFLERPKDDFLFSDYKTLHYSRNKFSVAFAKICKALDMPKNYSLYCWKHTGVVAYYRAGAKLKAIQMQCRHSSLDETNKYLKDLGLFENDNIFENAPEI